MRACDRAEHHLRLSSGPAGDTDERAVLRGCFPIEPSSELASTPTFCTWSRALCRQVFSGRESGITFTVTMAPVSHSLHVGTTNCVWRAECGPRTQLWGPPGLSRNKHEQEDFSSKEPCGCGLHGHGPPSSASLHVLFPVAQLS